MALPDYVQTIEQFASRSGMRLLEGQKAFELSQTLQLLHKADTAGFEALRDTEALGKQIEHQRKLINMVTAVIPLDGFDPLSRQRAISHTDQEGRKTLLISTAQDQDTTLHLVVMLRRPVQLKLHIYPEWFGSRVAKFLFRMQDIQLGDPILDPLVIVKAEQVREATRLLSGSQVQAELRSIYQAKNHRPRPVCNDISVRVSLGTDVPVDRLLWWHERLSALESTLQ